MNILKSILWWAAWLIAAPLTIIAGIAYVAAKLAGDTCEAIDEWRKT